MDYKFKAGQRVRILDVPSLGDRKVWAGREVTLKWRDGWGGPAWSVEEPDCHYRFRESEMALAGPIVTETVQRIKSGVYGRLGVGETYGANSVWVEVKEDRNGSMALTAPELRELALEIAEYLDAQ